MSPDILGIFFKFFYLIESKTYFEVLSTQDHNYYWLGGHEDLKALIIVTKETITVIMQDIRSSKVIFNNIDQYIEDIEQTLNQALKSIRRKNDN
jgi:hypothetical protein